MMSLLTVRFPGDKPCSRSQPSLCSSLRCHGCQHCFGTAVPFAATLYRDLLTAAGFCTSFYPRMDRLLLTNTAVTIQAQNHVSGGCGSQVGWGGATTQHWHSLLSPGCWSCPQVLHPAQGWGTAGGWTGTEASSILTQCQTRRVGMCSVLGEAERALLQAALLLLHLQPCTAKQHHISPEQ